MDDNTRSLGITPETIEILSKEIIKKLKVEYGETLVKNKGVVDVKTPVERIITQEAFDQLPSEQQNKGVWVIPGDGAGFNPYFPERYSTDEVIVGTWIDGKPLYRKVIHSTSATKVYEACFIAELEKECDIHRLESYLITPSNTLLPGNVTKLDSPDATLPAIITTFVHASRNKIMNQCNTPGWLNSPMILIVEYTKTTD